MAQSSETVSTGVVVWPVAQKYLRELSHREYRMAAKSPTEFERGRRAGRGEMCEELQNLPEALAILSNEDERVKHAPADVQAP